MGVGESLGSAPELASTNVSLNNVDGALNRYALGTVSGPASEFIDSSFLDFTGRIYRAVVGQGGTITETQCTPTMVVSGPVQDEPGSIHFTLVVRDDHILGPSDTIKPISYYFDHSNPSVDWVAAPLRTYFKIPSRVPYSYIWDRCRAAAYASKQNLDTAVPWLYGAAPVQMTKIAQETESYFVVGVPNNPDVYANIWYRIFYEEDGKVIEVETTVDNGIFTFIVSFDDVDLVCFCAFKADRPFLDKELWIVPTDASSEESTNPIYLLRTLMADHAKGGPSVIDAASFNAVEAASKRFNGAVAGVFEDSSSISGILEHVCPLLGLRTWIGLDDKLHVCLTGMTKAELGNLSDLPELDASDDYPKSTDGFPSITGTTPSDADDAGAAVTRVSIQWPDIYTKLFPIETASDRSSFSKKTKLAKETERRLAGDWIDPTKAFSIFSALLERSAYPTRTATMVTHPSILSVPTGSLLRVTNPFALGAWDRRLCRLLKADVHPSEHAAIIHLDDLGPTEGLKAGMLDRLSNWSAMNPNGTGIKLRLSNEYANIQTSSAVFSASMVGACIWVQGSSDAGSNRSYRITSVTNSTTAIVSPVPTVNEEITASPSGTAIEKSAWSIVHTHKSKGPTFRPDYIRGTNLTTGKFDDGTGGFQFVRH